jgi:hypothetical protein
MDNICTATEIATSNPEVCSVHDAHTAADWLAERGYDSAPVLKDDRPVGYVTRDAAEDAPSDESVTDIMEPLTVDVIIANNTPVDAVLESLYNRPFYYLADRSSVTGILTRADLNTEPVYQHLYIKVSRLEQTLRKVISEHVPDWRDTAPIHPEKLDNIDHRLSEAKEAGVALGPIHYTQFSTLVEIISDSEIASQAVGFDARHQAKSQLNAITNLRNDVAHSNQIIQNTDRGLGEAGRTITDLLEQYRLIERVRSTYKE